MQQAITEKALRVLILEDTPTDAELMERELHKAGLAFTSRRVATKQAFARAFEEFKPDVVLSDYHLPDFTGMDALKIVRNDHPEVPVIMVTGALPDIEAVELIHAGAKDYVLKDRLARLGPAVQRVLSMERGARARKAAERALRESEMKFRALVESTSDWIWEIDEHGVYTYSSPQVYDLLGYAAEEIIGKTPFELMPPDEGVRVKRLFDAIAAKRMPLRLLENTNLHKDGQTVYLETSGAPIFNPKGVLTGYRGVDRDITERKQVEAELMRLNRVLKTLSECDRSMLRASSKKELMDSMCSVITTSGGYPLAWIGQAQQDQSKRIEAVAIAGAGKEYVEALHLSWADIPAGQGPGGSAIRSGQTQVVQDIQSDPRFALRQEATQKYAFASCIALPLKEKEQVFGTLNIYADKAWAFSEGEVELLKDVANDLAFGIINLRTQKERDLAVKERQHYVERLRTSLEETLQAISATVEMRDPYTAGHQHRVAQLASAIAQEMGLSDEQSHGIYLAGVVHDLGKIRVPAEILSKPGRLSSIEYSLIQIHAQAGYDILKGIEFPWPIAQAVLQHHERLDGSGYPQGLKAGAILLEASILAVADVVEAMSSHRPYRAGLGLEVALQEIVKQRGVLYDPPAVDACLLLFREKGFAFV